MHIPRGTTALLVGGAGGIGRATARLLLADGAHVTIASRSEERLAAEAERLAPVAADGRRLGPLDRLRLARRRTRSRAAVGFAAEPTGRLDAAVAIAGGGPLGPVLRYDVATLEDTFRRNITSFYLVLQQAGQAMIRERRRRVGGRGVVDAGGAGRADVLRVLRGQGRARDAGALRGRRARRSPRPGERGATRA